MANYFFIETALDKFFCQSKMVCEWHINGYPVYAIFWNLILLSLPYFAAKAFRYFWDKSGFGNNLLALATFLLWLILMPNTLYVVTDIRHVSTDCAAGSYYHVCSDEVWLIGIFFVYASLGWLSFVYFLNQMKVIIEARTNKFISSSFIVATIPMIALGVLLGLINRFNSWDLFLRPMFVLSGIIPYLQDKVLNFDLVVFVVSAYILYFIGNYIFKRKF